MSTYANIVATLAIVVAVLPVGSWIQRFLPWLWPRQEAPLVQLPPELQEQLTDLQLELDEVAQEVHDLRGSNLQNLVTALEGAGESTSDELALLRSAGD
ncbi:predicted protein [Uncinocarpus reesii 1704]|uniref:Uncharacterized protein n=1 Tax=Uncinocarpus reesii (strain UAMH 1704) TaxID=336963 RepID=C4JYC8_UNCRE|nr:uncharacterized protein UREG_07179 [Uncinocarpus reesii 1704]EEP82314.1 predicted protein [Uncinocarpus reesii 1704]